MKLVFDWDEDKARRNRAKHKISFDEAKTIFGDPFLITIPDELHSQDEPRLVSIGTSARNRVILVVHTERDEDDAIVIRFINARKATAAERQVYEEAK
jgi:uncharacterized protein